jgi:hypothetical protein
MSEYNSKTVGDTKNAAPITIKFFKKQGCDAPTPRGYHCFSQCRWFQRT